MSAHAVEQYKNRWINLDHVISIRWEGGSAHNLILIMTDGSVISTQDADFQHQVFKHFRIEPS